MSPTQPLFCLGGFELNRYHTYPHSNGFTTNGSEMVIMQMMPDHTSLWMVPMDQINDDQSKITLGRRVAAFDLPQPTRDKSPIAIWPDIATQKNILTATILDSVWVLDLDDPSQRPRLLYVAPKGTELAQIASINAQATKVCFNVHDKQLNQYRCHQVELTTGKISTLLQTNWYMNHFHYSPFDNDWIGFCHEGPTQTIHDRIHAHHPIHMPHGQCLFDQKSDDPTQHLYMGHERWCFHEVSVLAIAYGASAAEPRGLYKIYPLRTPSAQLISQSDRDWHCNINSDGTLCVVDTTGPHDAPGKGWEHAHGQSDILLIDSQTGHRTKLASTQSKVHPWHPHPAFSPDSRWVIYNDFNGNDNQPRSRIGFVQIT